MWKRWNGKWRCDADDDDDDGDDGDDGDYDERRGAWWRGGVVIV